MYEERAQQQFLARLARQSADVLGVAVSRLTRRNGTIDDLLIYFETGTLPKRTKKDPPFPIYKGPGLLQIDDLYLAVRTVERYPHPLIPIIEQAHVTFNGLSDEQAIGHWKVLSGRERLLFPVGHSHEFTSALPLGRNLREFAQEVLGSQNEPEPDLPPIGDFLH